MHQNSHVLYFLSTQQKTALQQTNVVVLFAQHM